MKHNTLLGILTLVVLGLTGMAQTVDTLLRDSLEEPYGIAVDVSTTNNTYFITDSVNNRVVRYDQATSEFEDLTGAGLYSPQGIALAPARGGLVFSDSAQDRVVVISQGGTELQTFGGVPGYRDGAGADALFYGPSGVVVDPRTGNIYVADSRNNVVRLIDSADNVSTYARGFNRPTGLALDDAGNLLVADTGSHVIRLVPPGGGPGPHPVIAGVEGSNIYPTDLNGPRGLLWVGGRTGLLIADTGNHRIRRLAAGITTYAGAYRNLGDDDGAPLLARFFEPVGMAVDLNGAIVICDLKNNSIRRITRPAAATPVLTPATGAYSNTVQVTVQSLTTNSVYFYTTDGKDPTPASTPFPAALPLDRGPVGLKVRAFSPDYGASTVISNNYSFYVFPLAINTPGGAFTNDVALTVRSRTEGVSFRYSTDTNQPPTLDSPEWTDRDWGQSGTLLVRGFRTGFEPSAVFNMDWTFIVAAPVIYPPGPAGVVPPANNPLQVTLVCGTRGADLYWNIEGIARRQPTTDDTKYDGPFLLGTNGLVQVRAFKAGYRESALASVSYSLIVGDPLISPYGVSNSIDVVRVQLTTVTDPAQLFWTINGSDPTPDNGTLYAGPFDLANAGTLKVRGYRNGFVESGMRSASFNLRVADPVISPRGATDSNPVVVTLSSLTPLADLYWTIDGSLPSATHGTVYRGPFPLATAGTLKVIAVRDGFAASDVVSAEFALKVGTPTISPSSRTNFNAFTVTLGSATTGAALYWTIDGVDPTPDHGTLYERPFELTQNGRMKVRAFLDGFTDSNIAETDFGLVVADPVITPAGATDTNPVQVSLSSATDNAAVYWTIDGSEPAVDTSVRYTEPFMLGTNGVLKAKAFRNGFVSSQARSANFSLTVGALNVQPGNSTNINQMTITVSTSTTEAEVRYTTDGTEPTQSSARYTGPINIDVNTSFKAVGYRNGFVTSPVVAREYGIQVDTPTMTTSDPGEGYFPDGTTLTFTVLRPGAQIRYTLSGADPAADSTLYTGPFQLSALTAPGADLHMVKARAFAPNTIPSQIASGQPLSANKIGMPRNIRAGAGSTVVVPIVVNLRPGENLRSVQYKILAAPMNGAPNFTAELRAQALTANDFITSLGSPDTPSGTATYNISPYAIVNGPVITNVMDVSALGTNANLNVRSFAAIALLAVAIPGSAREGDQYTLYVAYPSGTSDGQQQVINLQALPPKTITVSAISYTVGDSSPGHWYSAGDFGSGDLDNADVNNAFYASLGVRVPYPYTDVFDAMDAFPEDTTTTVGGDGQIRYLDWQRILRRALRRDTANWERHWSGGVRVASSTNLVASPASPAEALNTSLVGSVWQPDAEVGAGNVGEVAPGQPVAVPVYVKMFNGNTLSGVQFRALVQPAGLAPVLNTAVEFTQAATLPRPVQLDNLPINQVGNSWSPLLNPIPVPLSGEEALGVIRFTVPASAVAGQVYAVNFASPDGSPDLETQLEFAARSGSVTVAGPARLEPSAAGIRGFKLQWQGQEGRKFVVESTTSLTGGQWRVEADSLIGRGRAMEFIDKNTGAQTKFYRVRAE